jgi:hypothetical protein
MRLLQGQFADGDTIVIDAEAGQLVFRRVEIVTGARG